MPLYTLHELQGWFTDHFSPQAIQRTRTSHMLGLKQMAKKSIPVGHMQVQSNEYDHLPMARDPKSGLWVVDVPQGATIHKSMPRTSKLTQDKDNAYRTQRSFFSTKSVADMYTRQDTKRNSITYEFQVLKPLRLVVLHHQKNLLRILARCIQEVKASQNDADALEALRILYGFALTTGMGLSAEELVHELKDMPGKPVQVFPMPSDSRLQLAKDCFVSPLPFDFKRVSIRTPIDDLLVKAICKYFAGHIDGYICANVPTFVVIKQYVNRAAKLQSMDEEIAMCTQEGRVEITVAGRIPHALGLQSAVFLDAPNGRIQKYLWPGANQHEVAKRELLAARVLGPHDALFATFQKFKKVDGFLVLERSAWDMDLAHFVASRNPTWAIMKHILKQCYACLFTVSELGYLHFDPKLANFLVNEDHGGPKVALSDFGSFKKADGPLSKYLKLQTDLKLFHMFVALAFRQETAAHQYVMNRVFKGKLSLERLQGADALSTGKTLQHLPLWTHADLLDILEAV